MTLPRSLLLILLISAAAAAENPASYIHLTNGDRLTGIPARIDENGHLVLASAENLAVPSAFKVSALLDLRLPPAGKQPPEANHQAVLQLTNGDTVRGQLSALDGEHITLESWYGGTLKIRRTMADGLNILQSQSSMYSGPDPLENWLTYGDAKPWSFVSGNFVTSGEGGIAREFDLPDKVHFSFDISWRDSLKFRAILFGDEGGKRRPENGFELLCQRSYVYFRKRWRGGDDNLGTTNIRELSQNEKVRLDLYADRQSGTFSLFVDGKQSHVWTDPNPDAGKMGNWLHLVSEGDQLRISRIGVAAWSGELPDDAGAEPADPPLDEDGQVIRLQNGDDLVGEVGSIKEGVLSFKTKYVDNIQVPVDRMRSIDLTLGPDEREEPRRRNGDIRAWLRDGGHITFQLKSFGDGKLTGYSQTFGTAEFDLNAFSRLEFNIHDEELESLRNTDGF